MAHSAMDAALLREGLVRMVADLDYGEALERERDYS